MRIDGTAYYTKDELAFDRADARLKSHAEVSSTMIEITLDAIGSMRGLCNPPLDFFDFPIEIGENWVAGSEIGMTGEVSGRFKISGIITMENTFSESIDETFTLRYPLKCPGIEEFSGLTCYEITLSFKDLIGMMEEMQGPAAWRGPLPDLPVVAAYYSPERRFIVGANINIGGVLGGIQALSEHAPSEARGFLPSIPRTAEIPGETWLSLNPISPREARKGIEAMGKAGIDWVLLAAILAPIVAVISVAVWMLRRKRMEKVKVSPKLGRPVKGLFCGYCGAGIPTNAELCPACGHKVPARPRSRT